MSEIRAFFPGPTGGYAQAVEVSGAGRTVFVSGQTAEAADGSLPDGFAAQCRAAWANVEARLAAAGLTLDHLVNVTVYLADPAFAAENRVVRGEVLGKRTPALTVVSARLLDPAWLVEINAVAMA